MKAQTYTNTYNGINYSSTRPYNLNVVYFVPNDITLDITYKSRLSALLLWGQNFYKQNMISNGYGSKTFGLFTEVANPNNIKIILIQGAHPSSAYPYNDASQLTAEINSFFANNPSQRTSEHTLVITAAADLATANVPFYGTGKTCYALDYPQFDIQYLGTYTYTFTGWFGGMMHELGHGMNLPHSHETNTETNNPNQGTNLMFYHGTLGASPTFVNRAGAAILNNSQIFADTPGVRYNGHSARFKSIHTSFSGGNLNVSGTFESNRTVKDVNIYQDPYATPSAGYYRTAWSVAPIGNTYSVSMPVSELSTATTGPYNLQIELVLENGEVEFIYLPFSYANGIPDINVNFDGVSACVGGSLQFSTTTTGTSYKWQYLSGASWHDYPEATVPGYATFSGTQTPTMTISNISSNYIADPNTIRVGSTQADGSIKYSGVQTWRAINCTLATSEIKEDKEQSVYPNPVKDELTVNLGSVKDDYDIEIINSLGQIVYKTTTSDQTLKVQLSDKTSGLYIVNIKGSKTGSNKSIKIIKK
ncbi:T9SS type A sorting domain-containing protein [Chryseobacterium sp. SIMBA_038]|uniref:T9SS type A sorting domain-containing protein n=2 Tax=Pseudomonadati TaxID=3379134 RepID=UPI003979A2A5